MRAQNENAESSLFEMKLLYTCARTVFLKL